MADGKQDARGKDAPLFHNGELMAKKKRAALTTSSFEHPPIKQSPEQIQELIDIVVEASKLPHAFDARNCFQRAIDRLKQFEPGQATKGLLEQVRAIKKFLDKDDVNQLLKDLNDLHSRAERQWALTSKG